MAPNTLRVPERQRATMARFAAMEPREFEALKAALEETKPSISTYDYGERVAAAAMLDSDLTTDIVGMLAGIYVVIERSDDGVSDFIESIAVACKESSEDDLAKITEVEPLRARLTDVLELHATLGMTAKAFDVLRDSERLYCASRVLTDARPVFVADDPTAPSASVILHSLRLTFHIGQGRETDNLYVTLDTDDLKNLRDNIDRALTKDEAVRVRMEAAGLKSLDWQEPKK